MRGKGAGLMDNIAGKKPALLWAVHISVVALVLLWWCPPSGLVSSFRTGDQIVSSGWWQALTQETQQAAVRIAGAETEKDGAFVIEGNLFPAKATD